jgi:hypothetical protein
MTVLVSATTRTSCMPGRACSLDFSFDFSFRQRCNVECCQPVGSVKELIDPAAADFLSQESLQCPRV